jgi:hypothetical protein
VSRYSDEQLSMLLGEHDDGNLRAFGGYEGDPFARGRQVGWYSVHHYPCPVGCAVQVLCNMPDSYAAGRVDPRLAKRFDARYRTNLSPEELLSLVAGVGR